MGKQERLSFEDEPPIRLYVNQEIKSNPTQFIIDPITLPEPSIVIPTVEPFRIHTFSSIMEEERKRLYFPTTPCSLNTAQFVAMTSYITEGGLTEDVNNGLPQHFKEFYSSYRNNQDLTLVSLDMDNLTSVNRQYSHLHGSIICSTLERTIIDVIKDHSGLLASMGEENLIALPVTASDGYLLSREILKRFSSIPFDFENGVFNQTVSAGVSALSLCEPNSFRHLMEMTGGALVYTKKNGKGFATVFGNKHVK